MVDGNGKKQRYTYTYNSVICVEVCVNTFTTKACILLIKS